jgi:hypothetical protein
MATMLPKKRVWLIGAAPRALDKWFMFAPSIPQAMNKAGMHAINAAAKTNVIILGGDLGSGRKMW